MYLSATNQKLQIVLSGAITTAEAQYQASWQDITSAGMTLPQSSSQGLTNSTTDVDMVAVPSASTTRQIVYLSVYNADSVAITLTIKKDVGGTPTIFIKKTLQTGDTLEWSREIGWTLTTGIVFTAGGSNTQIQYNSNGVLAGDTDFTFDPSNNDLSLIGTDANLILKGITSEPSAPSAGNLTFYSKLISGRMLFKYKPPSGLDSPLQPALFGNNVVIWNPAATSGFMTGSVLSVIAAGVAVAPTTTNIYTGLRRSTFTVATGVNLQNSLRSDAMFFRGASSRMGGFFFFCRFGFNTWTANNRLFVGLTIATTALTTGNPSALLNLVGFGIDSGDTAITFMHNDGAGTATKDPIVGQPALATNNGYDVYIFAKPNDTEVFWRIDDILTGTTIAEGSTSTDLPVNTTMMNAHAAIGSGSNAGAGVAVIGINRLYVETDY